MLSAVMLYLSLLGLVGAENAAMPKETKTETEMGTLKVGTVLPSFSGQTSQGARLSSRDLIGKKSVVVVSYAATWCQPCRHGIPIIERVVHTDETVQAVYITLDKESYKVQRWAENLSIQSPVIVDKFFKVAQRHGVVGEKQSQPNEIPLTIIVNENGIVTQILTIEGLDFEIKLRKAIAEARKIDLPRQEGSDHSKRTSDEKRGAD